MSSLSSLNALLNHHQKYAHPVISTLILHAQDLEIICSLKNYHLTVYQRILEFHVHFFFSKPPILFFSMPEIKQLLLKCHLEAFDRYLSMLEWSLFVTQQWIFNLSKLCKISDSLKGLNYFYFLNWLARLETENHWFTQ